MDFPQHYTLIPKWRAVLQQCPVAPPPGGLGESGLQVTGMIEWGENHNPQKSLDQKLTPKKSNAQFPSLKNFQKALSDNYNTKK